MTIVLLGIAASIATEIVTWINARLTNTVLKGDGAFLLAFVIALILATWHFIVTGGSFVDFGTSVATIWASSTAFFYIVVQGLGLDITGLPPAGTVPLGSAPQAKTV